MAFGTGLWLGSYWNPYWYPAYGYPAYGYPTYGSVAVESYPQSYIEQPAPSYWYYCEGAKAYYPYVRECAGGWLTVVPQPQPESPQ